MTSECYVYIVLPGQTRFTTAGRFRLDTDRHGTSTGRFVYGKTYLARPDAVAIDPVDLKLAGGTCETRSLGGMFGALRDASPDSWGRRVIESHVPVGRCGEVDYLLHSPDDRAGALGFGLGTTPPAPRRQFNRTIDLQKLQDFADRILAGESLAIDPDAHQAEELLRAGTSMGGARPKAVVEDGDALWIAKFNRPDDRWNVARVERAMLELARACGIRTADSRLASVGRRDVLLVRRFDRERDPAEDGYRRARMLSALTLLRAEESPTDRAKWSYVLLAEELRRFSSKPGEDAPELFRRTCCNALISNSDDHPRNHAVIAMGKDFRLSPAYDLTPHLHLSVERRDLAMACGDMGRYAHARNLRSQSARFLLREGEADALLETMERVVAERWEEIARREGVSANDCRKIAGAFAYAGFRLPLEKSAPTAG